MISLILKFLGVGIPAILDQITKERAKQADAKTEQEKIASEERIKVLEAKKDIILKSQGERIGEWVRLAWALPFIIYIWKLLLWDKVMGWGATDALSPTLEYIMWTVLGGYFLLSATTKLKK